MVTQEFDETSGSTQLGYSVLKQYSETQIGISVDT